MKSEHRHELKTNELAAWLANLPQWTTQHLKTIIYVSVLIVIVAGTYFWKHYQIKAINTQEQLNLTGLISQSFGAKARIIQAQERGIDVSDTLLQNAGRLGEIALETKNDHVSALALIKQAQLLRTNLHYRFGEVDEIDLTSQIARAKSSYSQAIEKAGSASPLAGIAKLGLGLCEEELGNFDQAKAIYAEVSSESNFDGTAAQAQARQRLAIVDLFKTKLVLKSSPKKVSAPQEQAVPVEAISPQVEIPESNEAG